MTLHEAIVSLLSETKRPMSTDEIAIEINNRKSYQKKDCSLITAYQIHGRTKNYPNLFSKSGTIVSLTNSPIKIQVKTNEISPLSVPESTCKEKSTEFEKELFNIKNFKNIAHIDYTISKGTSGFYCIRLIDINKLPQPFCDLLLHRKHSVVYIGLATKCLHTRFINQELRAKGSGTFFRSIGTVLGYLPLTGSLTNKRNKINYIFSKNDQQKIIKWINENLIVNWVQFSGNFESEETRLILKYQPLFNLSKNPVALPQLRSLRANCIKIANQIT